MASWKCHRCTGPKLLRSEMLIGQTAVLDRPIAISQLVSQTSPWLNCLGGELPWRSAEPDICLADTFTTLWLLPAPCQDLEGNNAKSCKGVKQNAPGGNALPRKRRAPLALQGSRNLSNCKVVIKVSAPCCSSGVFLCPLSHTLRHTHRGN